MESFASSGIKVVHKLSEIRSYTSNDHEMFGFHGVKSLEKDGKILVGIRVANIQNKLVG